MSECEHDWGYYEYETGYPRFVRSETGARCQKCLVVRNDSPSPPRRETLTLTLSLESTRYRGSVRVMVSDMSAIPDETEVALVKLLKHYTQQIAQQITVAFCVKCRRNVEVAAPKDVLMKNGRPAVRGVCPNCNTQVFRIG